MSELIHIPTCKLSRFRWFALCLGTLLCLSPMPVVGQVPATDQGQILKLQPRYVSAADLSKAVQLALGNQGSQVLLEEQGTVLLSAPPEALQRVTRLLEQVDIPRSQVRLAVYMFDVEVNELQRVNLVNATAIQQQSFSVLANHLRMDQALQLLAGCPSAKPLADPQLMVIDRQTATFSNTVRWPDSVAVRSNSNASHPTMGFEEIGVKLAVTPRVIDSSTVELRLAPQYSSITGYSNQGDPIVEVRRAETTVRLMNGQTLIMSGLRKRALPQSALSTRVNNSETNESELICIVRAELVDTQPLNSADLVQQLRPPQLPPPQPPMPPVFLASIQEVPSLIQPPAESEATAWVNNGVYQAPLVPPVAPQIAPSAYRPSVYNKQRPQSTRGRNINSSRNAVTQPLPTAIRR